MKEECNQEREEETGCEGFGVRMRIVVFMKTDVSAAESCACTLPARCKEIVLACLPMSLPVDGCP